MEFSTTIIWVLAIHCLAVFIVSISILSCSFRYGHEKLALFLLTWLIPFIGPIFSHHRIGYLGSIRGIGSSGDSTAFDTSSSSVGCDSEHIKEKT